MIASRLKENPRQSLSIQFEDKFLKPADWYWWAALTLANIADIHSTNKAMDYSCIEEANPFLPKRPSLERLIVHKVVVLYPIYQPEYNRYVVTNEDVKWATALVSLVAYHNYRVIDKAEKYADRCPKIGTF